MPESKICCSKKCPNRGLPQSPEQFGKDAQTADGLRRRCIQCERREARESRERIKARQEEVTTPGAPIPEMTDLPFEVEIEETPPDDGLLQLARDAHATAQSKRDLKREHSALLDENERLKSRISELVEMQAPIDVLVYEKPKWERVDMIACAIASDWHVEEEVVKESVHGLNEYNLDIAQERSRRFFQHLLKLAIIFARESRIRTIFISALGDFFSGWIHKELMSATLLPPGKAANFFQQMFVAGIEYLLKEGEFDIEIDMIPGNHGRMTDVVYYSDPTGTSLETLAYHAIAMRFRDNPRVRINVAAHPMIYRRFFESFVVRQIHGYETKFNGGVGGLTIPLNKAIAQWDKLIQASQTWLGHYHQLMSVQRFTANGSSIGYNSYAQFIKAEPEEPQQAFLLIHARRGGQATGVHRIWLTDDTDHDLAPYIRAVQESV